MDTYVIFSLIFSIIPIVVYYTENKRLPKIKEFMGIVLIGGGLFTGVYFVIWGVNSSFIESYIPFPLSPTAIALLGGISLFAYTWESMKSKKDETKEKM